MMVLILFYQQIDLMTEFRNIRYGGSPKNLRKNFRITMYQYMTHPYNGIPWNLWVLVFVVQ